MLECSDFMLFQDALKKLREIDDKIIYTLNTTVPTESFRGQVDVTAQCKTLYEQLENGHNNRENLISKCITHTVDNVKKMKAQKENNDDIELNMSIRAEQNKLRLLQVELNVEQVIRESSDKVFRKRCRSYFDQHGL